MLRGFIDIFEGSVKIQTHGSFQLFCEHELPSPTDWCVIYNETLWKARLHFVYVKSQVFSLWDSLDVYERAVNHFLCIS